jgi:hypothetical protein
MWAKSGTPLLGAVALDVAVATVDGVAVAVDVAVAVAMLDAVADGANVAVAGVVAVVVARAVELPQLAVSMASNTTTASVRVSLVALLARVRACNTSRAFRSQSRPRLTSRAVQGLPR